MGMCLHAQIVICRFRNVLLGFSVTSARHTRTNFWIFSLRYAIPGWSGGVYGTPNNAGSQHCTHTLHAYLAMLAIGKSGFVNVSVPQA